MQPRFHVIKDKDLEDELEELLVRFDSGLPCPETPESDVRAPRSLAKKMEELQVVLFLAFLSLLFFASVSFIRP